jgi:hypothetical protein
MLRKPVLSVFLAFCRRNVYIYTVFVVSKPVLPEVGIPPTSSVFLKKMQTKSFTDDFLRRPHPVRPHMDTPYTSTLLTIKKLSSYTLCVMQWSHAIITMGVGEERGH